MVLVKNGKSNSMSSIRIAELTGKQHQHVKRDIEKMLNDLEIDTSKFGRIYLDTSNRHQTCYELPERELLILASGYNVKLRASIIDELAEIRERLANPLRNSIEFYKRYEINKQNIPAGYFSMIEETINRVIIPLELDGKDLLKESLPDGSLGRGFCAFLREKGIDTSKFPTYKHSINKVLVEAKLYKDEYFVFFKQYINDWIKGNGNKYFNERTTLLLK